MSQAQNLQFDSRLLTEMQCEQAPITFREKRYCSKFQNSDWKNGHFNQNIRNSAGS